MKRLGEVIDAVVVPGDLPRAIVLNRDFPELKASRGAVFSRINGSPLWTMPGKQFGILSHRVRKGLKTGEFEEVIQ